MNFVKAYILASLSFFLLISCQRNNLDLEVKKYYDQIRDASPFAADSLIHTIDVDVLSDKDQQWYSLLNLMVRSKKDSACLMNEFESVMQDEAYSNLVKQENFQFILSEALDRNCEEWRKNLLEPFLKNGDGNWKKGYPYLMLSYGNHLRLKKFYAQAFELLELALEEFREKGLDKPEIRCNYYLGLLENSKGNTEESKVYFDSIIENEKAKEDTFLMVYSSALYADVLGKTQNYEKAIDLALNALYFAEESGQKTLMFRSYITLGTVYYYSGDYAKSLVYRNKRYQLAEDMGSEMKMARALNSLGITLNEMGEWDRAKEKFLKSLAVRKKMKVQNRKAIALLEMNIGAIHIEKGNLDSAQFYFNKAKETDGSIIASLDYNVDLAKLYFLQNRGRETEKQMIKADDLAEKEENVFKRLYNLDNLKQYYLSKGNKAAYAQHDVVYDELYSQWQNESKAKEVARFQAEFNHEKQLREIESLELENDFREIKLREENAAKRTLAVVAISVVLLALVLSRLWYQQKKAKELTQKMMKELHHRVKNNLQMLSGIFSLQAMQAENEEVRLSITDNEARVTAMNLIHAKLYQESEQLIVNLDEYMGEIIENLEDVYAGEKTLSIKTDFPQFKINVDKSLTIGLLVNELCTNTFKYASPEGNNLEILVRYSIENNYLKNLTIKDNGREFELKPEGSGFGTRLIHLLSKQLKADYQNKWENGFVQVFDFKRLKGA